MRGKDGAMKDFHAHLDECEQCRNHPFDLCGLGAVLLILAAGDDDRAETLTSLIGEDER